MQIPRYTETSPKDLFLESVGVTKLTEGQICNIEESTRGQHQNKNWMAERSKRITSSHFGCTFKCKQPTDKTKLAKSLVVPVKFDSAPTRHGCKHEHVAISKYEEIKAAVTVP